MGKKFSVLLPNIDDSFGVAGNWRDTGYLVGEPHVAHSPVDGGQGDVECKRLQEHGVKVLDLDLGVADEPAPDGPLVHFKSTGSMLVRQSFLSLEKVKNLL